MSSSNWERNVKLYDQLISLVPGIERKGKSVPYTSDNGYMFSLFNKDGEMGIRLSKKDQEEFSKEYEVVPFKSHGAVMREYVLIPEKALKELDSIAGYLKRGHRYVNSLPPK